MSDALEGARLKLRRADLHADAVRRLATRFFDSNPYPLSVEAHPVEGRYTYRVHVEREFPRDAVGVTLGDAMHNYRSALDHVAWQLALGHSKAIPDGDTRTQFPIFRTTEGFRSRGAPMTAWMGDRAKSAIEAIQPYHHDSPATTALSLVREFDNTDKHRVIPVAVAMFETAEHIGNGLPAAAHSSVKITVDTGPVEDGMELLSIALDVPQPQFNPRIKVNWGIMFTNPPVPDDQSRIEIPSALATFSKEVRNIIDIFTPAFAGGRYVDSDIPKF